MEKMFLELELKRLPAPKFEMTADSTQVILFGPKKFEDLDTQERIRATYFHGCIQFRTRTVLTNSSLWERFDVGDDDRSKISRLISQTVAEDLLKPKKSDAARKSMSYVPYWA